MEKNIPFNRPHLTDQELNYIRAAEQGGALAGDGPFTRRCQEWIEKSIGAKKVLLTHSCTAALEMMVLIADLAPGDEVIMPSYTFVSTANAFAMRGVDPVFIDIRDDTLNMDERLIEAAITERTRGICVVHYAGVGCEMSRIQAIAQKHGLIVFEDAAQAFLAKHENKSLGTWGDLGAFSFHETKNIISGEGGALVVNRTDWIERAEIVRDKGTNRAKFFRGQVDKYTWVDLGSSYLPGEIIGAFLFAQLERAESINQRRIGHWNRYMELLAPLSQKGHFRVPFVPSTDDFNAHMFYVILESEPVRAKLIAFLKARGILTVFHYVPLHSSPAGQRYGRAASTMTVTDSISDRLLRLPMYFDLTAPDIDRICAGIGDFFALGSNPVE